MSEGERSSARFRALCALAVLLASSASARAAGPAGVAGLPYSDAVLAKLLEESLAARPELRGAEADARAERERIPQAGALPDPSLSLGIQNDGFGAIEVGRMETSYYQLMATQPLPWPGKRALRTRIAELGASAAEKNVSRLRLETEADVRRGYLALVLARDRLALLGTLESLWKKSAAIARARYEAGQGAQSDVLRAQLEQNRLRQRRFAQQAGERESVQVLNRLRGRPLDLPIPTSASVRDLPAPPLQDPEAAVADALERSPELAAARLGAERAERAGALARRDRFPDLSVSAGVMPRGSLDPMWNASVGVTLPIWAGRKQNRAVAESAARSESAARGAEAVEQVLRLRVHERHAALAALLDTLRLYREGLLVESRATAESTLAQYQVGRVTFASVLEANVGYVNDEDGYLQASAAAQRIAIASAEVSLDPVGASAEGGMASPSVPGAGAAPAGAPMSGSVAGAAPGETAASSSGM